MPSLSVVQTRAVAAQERRARRLLAAERHRPVEQAGHEPLEPDRHLDEAPAERLGDPVDHARADERLADAGVRRPVVAVRVEVLDRHREEVVGVEEPAVLGHDAVPVRVGVVARRDVVRRVAGHLPDERGHRRRRRAVHPDLAVPVERHEAPRRVDPRVDDRQVEMVPFRDRRPVVDARTTQRVGADPDPCVADRGQVEHRRQVVDVRAEVVVRRRRRRRAGPGQRHPADVLQAVAQDLVGPVLHPAGDVAARRSAVRRVVLEAAVARWVVRRRHHDAVGAAGVVGRPVAVVTQDRVGHRRCRGPAVPVVDEHRHVVGGEDLQSRRPGRLGEAVGVAAQEQRTGDAGRAAVLADRLAGCRDVVLVERVSNDDPRWPDVPKATCWAGSDTSGCPV